jgi:hypothetical protein
MNIPDINRFLNLQQEFASINPGMTAADNPNEYLIYWNCRMNIINNSSITALDERVTRTVRALNELSGKFEKLEKKIKKLEEDNPDLFSE